MISGRQRKQLIADLDEIDSTEKTVTWDKAKKSLRPHEIDSEIGKE